MSQQFQLIFSGPAQGKKLSGAQLRDWGVEDALARAERVKGDYVAACLKAIESFPRGAMLTSEDVRAIAGDVPVEINHSVLAGILKKAQSQKLIAITGETRQAKRASVHAKRISVWRRI